VNGNTRSTQLRVIHRGTSEQPADKEDKYPLPE